MSFFCFFWTPLGVFSFSLSLSSLIASSSKKKERKKNLSIYLARPAGQESVDVDRVLLPDPVRARHRLEVVLRVPVRVEDDDGVGRREVDAEAAGAGGEQEDEVARIRGVEVVHRLFLVISNRGTESERASERGRE